MTFKNKGFTLIELLVVIAIIGILSSVVLASLNSARNKGTDAAIKAELNNLRPAVELFYDGNGASGYSGWNADTGVAQILTGLASKTTVTNGPVSSTSTWAAAATLKSGGWHCVDYRGVSLSGTGTIPVGGSDATCN